MIQELKIRNFKLFRDEVELSFEPSEDDRYNSMVVMPDGVKLLRFAVVLGANASSKSNLIDAVEFLRRFWNILPFTNDDGTDVQPFLLRNDALSFCYAQIGYNLFFIVSLSSTAYFGNGSGY